LVHHRNMIEAATASGVAHVVLLSGLDADLSSPFCYAVTYARTEEMLAETRLTVSIARASIFAEFFMRWVDAARATGEIRAAAADGRISLVSRADVADCLAALAIGPVNHTTTHEVTGP